MAENHDDGKVLDRGQFVRRALLAAGGMGLAAGMMGSLTPGEAALAASKSSGNSRLYQVLKRGYVRVGTGTGNPPWHFSQPNGQLVGFDIVMAQILSNGLFGKPDAVRFVIESPDARIPNILTNKVDIVIDFMTVTAQRAQQVAFTIPYYREGVGLLVTPHSRYKTYKELLRAGSSVTVSVLLNVYAQQLVHQALPKAKVLQVDTPANVIQAVVSGQADAAATDDSTVRWLSTQHPGQYLDAGYSWYPQTYAAAVAPDDQIWLNFVNTTFHEAMTGVAFPEYAAGFKQYFGRTLPQPAIGFPEEFAPYRA